MHLTSTHKKPPRCVHHLYGRHPVYLCRPITKNNLMQQQQQQQQQGSRKQAAAAAAAVTSQRKSPRFVHRLRVSLCFQQLCRARCILMQQQQQQQQQQQRQQQQRQQQQEIQCDGKLRHIKRNNKNFSVTTANVLSLYCLQKLTLWPKLLQPSQQQKQQGLLPLLAVKFLAVAPQGKNCTKFTVMSFATSSAEATIAALQTNQHWVAVGNTD